MKKDIITGKIPPKKFRQLIAEIVQVISLRESSPHNPLYNTPDTSRDGYLAHRIFEYTRERRDAGKMHKVKQIARSYGHAVEEMEIENGFEAAALAINAALGPISEKQRTKIGLLAKELFWADAQNIEPENLIGAIYQNGGARKIKKLLKLSHPGLFKPVSSVQRASRAAANDNDAAAASPSVTMAKKAVVETSAQKQCRSRKSGKGQRGAKRGGSKSGRGKGSAKKSASARRSK